MVKSSPQWPEPPPLGQPHSYIRCIWKDAPDNEPVEWFDELDETCLTIRCVRMHGDGRLEAHSYADDDWRDAMPEGQFPSLAVINQDGEFSAVEISRDAFEQMWDRARGPIGT